MITVIGLGFVGLTTALGFCEKGYKVYGYDIDSTKLKQYESGMMPFFEPYLKEKLTLYVNNQFTLVKELKQGMKESKFIFLCVGTPSKPDGSSDLTFIMNAIREVLKNLEGSKDKIIVIKSTIPPSTSKNELKPYIESHGYKVGVEIGLANNPEFLREGYAWNDFMEPDRIVIGCDDRNTALLLEQLYKPFQSPIYLVSLNTAEYIKYLSNTLLASLISFANEQSLIGKAIGDIDIGQSFRILHQDKRWFGKPAGMSSYVYPGCGFGGYCLPKDAKALINASIQHSYTPRLLESAVNVNKQIKEHIVQEIITSTKENEVIGILGLAFKPNSDDVRETPAFDIISALLEYGYNNIIAFDPLAIDSFKAKYQLPIKYAMDVASLLNQSNKVVILTAWDEFKETIKSKQHPCLYDYRYFLQ